MQVRINHQFERCFFYKMLDMQNSAKVVGFCACGAILELLDTFVHPTSAYIMCD